MDCARAYTTAEKNTLFILALLGERERERETDRGGINSIFYYQSVSDTIAKPIKVHIKLHSLSLEVWHNFTHTMY